MLLFGGTLAVHGADAYLTNVQQILDLGRGGGQRPSAMVPAQLQGVVTFAFEGVRSIFVQDATGGIQVNYTSSDVRVVAGQLVEVSGRGGPALVTPIVTDGRVRVLGTAPMPEGEYQQPGSPRERRTANGSPLKVLSVTFAGTLDGKKLRLANRFGESDNIGDADHEQIKMIGKNGLNGGTEVPYGTRLCELVH